VQASVLREDVRYRQQRALSVNVTSGEGRWCLFLWLGDSSLVAGVSAEEGVMKQDGRQFDLGDWYDSEVMAIVVTDEGNVDQMRDGVGDEKSRNAMLSMGVSRRSR